MLLFCKLYRRDGDLENNMGIHREMLLRTLAIEKTNIALSTHLAGVCMGILHQLYQGDEEQMAEAIMKSLQTFLPNQIKLPNVAPTGYAKEFETMYKMCALHQLNPADVWNNDAMTNFSMLVASRQEWELSLVVLSNTNQNAIYIDIFLYL